MKIEEKLWPLEGEQELSEDNAAHQKGLIR